MSTHHASQKFRLGLIIHGNKVWISEFLSIFFVSTVIITLFTLTLLIFINEALIRVYDRRISTLSSEKVVLTNELFVVSSKAKIVGAMRAFLGKKLSTETYSHLAGLVYENSTSFGYDPLLLLAVIHVESRFSQQANGKYRDGTASGAFGLMQIKLETAQEIATDLGMKVVSVNDLYRPNINIPLGVAYLTRLISRFRSFKLGLLAYNQGPGVIRGQLAAQEPLSIGYYNKVLKSYYKLRAITDSLGYGGEPAR
jgi:hypothetical protein